MKKLTTIILLSVITVITFSCKKAINGEGPLVSQTRSLPSFTGIDLRIPGDVYYKNDTVRKVEVIAQQNILDRIETFVSGNTLTIKFFGSGDFRDAADIRINISGPNLNGFVLNTAGSIYCMNDIQASNIYLRSSGSGSIYLQRVTAELIDAETSGSGSINASLGTATREQLKTIGSGPISLAGISARTVIAQTNGSGSIRVKVSDHLNARINGSGFIYFNGYPSITQDVSGSGKLIRF